jgi:DNA sulfur modification protein DndC
MAGNVQLMANGKEIPGPYLQQAREGWLAELLRAQTHIRRAGGPAVKNIDLITLGELQEIRRIWVVDKHEIEDALPRIYRDATGEDYPGRPLDDNLVLGQMEMIELDELCGEDRMHYELTRELLSITLQQRNMSRRAGLFEHLDKTFRRHFYDDKEDALARAERIAKERQRYKIEKQDRAFRVAEGEMIETETEA